jgi:UTP--glucose-1-phosphate uridylyltransferase
MFDAIEEAMRRFKKETAGSRELVYIDAIKILMERGKSCHAVKISNGDYYDCGNKLGYLKAVVKFGLQHEDLRKDFGTYLKNLDI